MKLSSSFYKIARMKHKNKVVQGSKGAGKTFGILQRWILMAARSNKSQLCSIVSDTLPNLKTGAIRDFENICKAENILVTGTKSPHVYRINQWTFEFFSVDKENKGLGGRRDRLFINEANRMPWKIARQLISRTHKERIFDFNPVQKFWAHEQYVDVDDCNFVKLTYKDNEYLPISEVEDIEKHAPWGTNPDENFWRVYGLGEVGYTENMILAGYKTFKELPEDTDLQSSIGVDWGWNDPMTAVRVHIDHANKRLYWRELFYASECKVSALIPILKDYPSDYVFCDHNPAHIIELVDADINAYRANKKIQLEERVKILRQYDLYIHEDSQNLINEADAWKYQERNGIVIPYPDQKCEDHGMDAGAYGTISLIR